jgi:hypothetical protein
MVRRQDGRSWRHQHGETAYRRAWNTSGMVGRSLYSMEFEDMAAEITLFPGPAEAGVVVAPSQMARLRASVEVCDSTYSPSCEKIQDR